LEQQDTITDPQQVLVRRAQAGDTAAFEQLYRTHVDRVYALCFRMVADEERAVRLTQDAFVRAWEHLVRFRAESAFSTWLYRVASNVVLMDLRSTRRRNARFAATDDPTCFEETTHAPTPGLAMDLEQAIAALPLGARSVLVLHEIEGYRHDEIADMMGIAAGTSKAQLHRARKLLKKMLNR